MIVRRAHDTSAAPAYEPDGYDETPQPYAFQYGVKDDYSQANFNAQESADGMSIHLFFGSLFGQKSYNNHI